MMKNAESPLSVNSEIIEGVQVIMVKGRFDHINIFKLKDLSSYVKFQNPKIILDLSKVDYASSSFIHFLINFDDLVKKNKGALAIVIQSEFVLNVISLTGGLSRHKIFRSRKDAMAYFKTTHSKDE